MHTRLAPNTLQRHTQLQQVAVGQLVNRGGEVMTLDRGILAKIDRRVFAELDHAAGSQAVKVPLPDAVWSVWRRYCEALGMSMGEAVAGLISHELVTVLGEASDGDAVFAERVEREAQAREARLEAWEQKLVADTERLRSRERQLRTWEQRIRSPKVSAAPTQGQPKVGRNQKCPCESGRKYKHCHGG
ncbi:MAG: hypothetical protein GY788_22480 [bacterium]|nr:hypothetical protein [bacterium]